MRQNKGRGKNNLLLITALYNWELRSSMVKQQEKSGHNRNNNESADRLMFMVRVG